MSAAPFRIEPLGAMHDRAAFRSGVPALDRYLHDQASQDARRRVTTPFVMIDGSGSILGYYTLSAFGVQSGELPDTIARKLPRYPLLPATLLGRLAVRQSQQGQGLGHFLLVDALRRSLDSTYNVASIGVVVEALDENASTFYKRHGFTELNDHPSRLFLPMATIEKAFKVR